MSSTYQTDTRFAGSMTTTGYLNSESTEVSYTSGKSSSSRIVSARGTDADDFEESGLFEYPESRTHPVDYRDWTLFNENLVTIDTSRFFPDLDLITDSIDYESNVDGGCGTTDNPPNTSREANSLAGPAHQVVQEANEVPFEATPVRSQDSEKRWRANYSSDSTASTCTNPLETWVRTFERHEFIAERLERPLYPVGEYDSYEIRPETESAGRRAYTY